MMASVGVSSSPTVQIDGIQELARAAEEEQKAEEDEKGTNELRTSM
jgi:hypothetical protein